MLNLSLEKVLITVNDDNFASQVIEKMVNIYRYVINIIDVNKDNKKYYIK